MTAANTSPSDATSSSSETHAQRFANDSEYNDNNTTDNHRKFSLWDLVPRTKWSILYMLVTIIFTATILVLEALIFAWFTSGFGKTSIDQMSTSDRQEFISLKSTIPTYMALFIFAGAYQIGVAFLALSRKNTFQLLLLIVFSFAMLIYAGIQYDQIRDSYTLINSDHTLKSQQIRSIIIAIPCIIAGECVILMILSWRLYLENNKKIFQEIGASSSRKRARRDLRIFETIILFDFFFFVGFTLQFVLIILETKGVEFGLTIAVIPVTAIVLLVAVIAVYKEIRAIVYLFLVFCLAGLAYFLYKLVRIYTTKGEKHDQYIKASKTLTVFAAITIAFLIITMLMTLKCLSNFGYNHGKSFGNMADDDIDLGGPEPVTDDGYNMQEAYYSQSNTNYDDATSVGTGHSGHNGRSVHSSRTDTSSVDARPHLPGGDIHTDPSLGNNNNEYGGGDLSAGNRDSDHTAATASYYDGQITADKPGVKYSSAHLTDGKEYDYGDEEEEMYDAHTGSYDIHQDNKSKNNGGIQYSKE
ncbi:uncharacterized protein SAPINGB_P000781 [Magnusiomyces paraingens]|uniref:Uncharacterized protein n=1 Tax=Magnusiomyces paraingens TaxID=2606893 RepID=A0A5E8B3Z0_9ASCO|nr:uncharacterized protein SAPINGB_P000781 [Saprochaete ingens]VVT45531.1 unnamed protein product [Saprochaete ingens]